LVDDDEAFAKARGYMRTFMPRAGNRLVRYSDRMPLFSRYQVEDQIDRIYQRKIGLPSGGSIVIDGTEALTAIDVNSGRATRGGSQEETAYATNMEAAREVARQLRMRDIGGLMVVDFIDMRSSKHRREVEKTMRDSLKDDKARTFVTRLSDNGLLEINRQRLKKALQLRTHRPCPTCSGTGNIASPELVGLNLLRRIETRAVTGSLGGVRIELHPELADALQNDRRQELAALEREFDIRVEIVAAAGIHRSEERVEWRPRKTDEETQNEPAVSAADLAEGVEGGSAGRSKAKPSQTDDMPASAEPAEDTRSPAEKGKPRRRSRGGRRRKKPASGNSAVIATQEAKAGEAEDRSEVDTTPAGTDTPHSDETATKKPSRRRRGGRRRKKPTTAAAAGEEGVPQTASEESPATRQETESQPADSGEEAKSATKPRRRRPRRPRKKAPKTESAGEGTPPTDVPSPDSDPFSY
ncbi:MAG: ribonuclease E/G, partial [Acidobacteria bacterium]|nr:ribonuclease E/G [Acidobacteriota bacterium]